MRVQDKILVVDDDQRNLMIIEEILGDNYELKTAQSGEECLDVLENYTPDLILLDIMLPGMDGYTILDKIRSIEMLKYTKTILVSGKAMVDEKLKGYDAGADDYITKPFIDDELFAKVKIFTQLANSEKQLSQLNQSLEKRVEIQSEQLVAKEKMAFLGMHIAEIIHNLKNPLAIIKGYAELIKMRYPYIEEISKIDDGSKNISDIINTILTTSREENITKRKKININQVIENELNLLKSDSFFKNNVAVDLTLSPLPNIYGVFSHFGQIFGNIIVNAIHAMTNTKTKVLSIQSSLAHNYIQVSIADTGQGISKENIDKIFDSFFTTKPLTSDSDSPSGNGLGLSSVKKMLESYGGNISVQSDLEKGTKFDIYIPLS